MERIGFGKRFGAALIDVVIVFICLSIIGLVFGVGASAAFQGGVGASWFTAVLMAGLGLAYTSLEIFKAHNSW